MVGLELRRDLGSGGYELYCGAAGRRSWGCGC